MAKSYKWKNPFHPLVLPQVRFSQLIDRLCGCVDPASFCICGYIYFSLDFFNLKESLWQRC